MNPNTVRACAVDALKDGEMQPVAGTVDPIGIGKAGGEWFAFENNCTHDDFPLTEGVIEGAEIECPLHGARYCLRTGKVRAVPATCSIRIYPVHVVGSDVFIELPI